MVTFWSIIIGTCAIIGGIHILVPKDINILIPVIARKYWFVTIYFALCIFSPFINKLEESLTKNEFKRLLRSMFFIFVCVPTISYLLNFPSITLDSGYGLFNFIMLYLLGRYLRKHHSIRNGKWFYFGCYIISMGLCGFFQIILSHILGFKFTSFISYDSIFCFFGSVFMFLFFSKLSFQNRLINELSTYCLAIYIIHIHPWTFDWLYQDFLRGNQISGINYILFILILPFVTFILCAIAEFLRRKLSNIISYLCKKIKDAFEFRKCYF